MREDISPSFYLRATPDKGLQYGFGSRREVDRQLLEIDLTSLTEAVLKRFVNGAIDQESGTVSINTGSTQVSFIPSKQKIDGSFPFDSIRIDQRGKQCFLIKELSIGKIYHRHLLEITSQDLNLSKLPIIYVNDETVPHDDLHIPTDFGENQKELDVAKKLQELFERKSKE